MDQTDKMFSPNLAATDLSKADTFPLMAKLGRPAKPGDPRYPNRIRELREAKGKTQEWLAEHVHMSVSNVGKKERGMLRLKMDELPLFARALECDVTDLLPTGASLSPRARALLDHFDGLQSDEQDQLLKFALFLANSPTRAKG